MSKLTDLINELCPDGVEYVKLGSLCNIVTKQTGFDYSKHIKDRLVNEEIDGSVPYIQTKFFNGKSFSYNTDYFVPNDIVEQFPKITLDEKCLLFSIVGASIGNVGLFPGDKRCFLGGAICVAKVKSEYCVEYLYYCIESEYVQNQIRKMTKGAGQATITVENVREFVIPFPPIEIQHEIVRILDSFMLLTEELKTKLTAELTARKMQYEYYKKKLFDIDDVEYKRIGDFTDVFSASRVHKEEWTNQGVPFWRSSDLISFFNGVDNPRGKAFISYELYEKLAAKSGKIHKDDILITGGGTIGIPYLVPNDAPLYVKDADLLCIKKNTTVISKYLYHYFLSEEFRSYLSSITHDATIAHYTITQIKETPVPVPCIELQKKIVEILDRFDVFTKDILRGLLAEINARRKQYEYYRDKLLSFKELTA